MTQLGSAKGNLEKQILLPRGAVKSQLKNLLCNSVSYGRDGELYRYILSPIKPLATLTISAKNLKSHVLRETAASPACAFQVPSGKKPT